MNQSSGDFALFFRRAMNKLISIFGAYVDDILQTGTQEEKRVIQDELGIVFDVKISDAKKFVYTGLTFGTRTRMNARLLNSTTSLSFIFSGRNILFRKFRSLGARLA